MANYNKVLLVGNLTRDPELRRTPTGTAVTTISLAINRQWKDNRNDQEHDETTFVDVDAFGRTAEVLAEHLAKGRSVLVEGRLKTDSWEDKKSGVKRNKLKVICERCEFLGSAPSGRAKPAAPDQGQEDETIPF